jgi:hypothetical protein
MVLHLGLTVFRLFNRHALNTGRAIVYGDKRPGSDYSIVTLKSNGGKDVTPDRGFAMGKWRPAVTGTAATLRAPETRAELRRPLVKGTAATLRVLRTRAELSERETG